MTKDQLIKSCVITVSGSTKLLAAVYGVRLGAPHPI
jgi:hypothetical protein